LRERADSRTCSGAERGVEEVEVVEQALLDILVCPESKQPIRPADEGLLARLNSAIQTGDVRNRGGELVTEAVQEGLVREDGLFLYPVRDDIPIMLIDEAIPLEGMTA
jgi:uncharacterized protein YbaR (Trm112 family)